MNHTPHCPQCHAALPASGYAGLCPSCVASSLASLWSDEGVAGAHEMAMPQIPGWRLLAPLGAGGQGMVWRACSEDGQRVAAIKIFRNRAELDDNDGDDTLDARWEQEMELLKKLNSPGIVRLLDAGLSADGQRFLATELVEGCDLQRLLRASVLGTERALEIGLGVAKALHHAHSRGVVHRDVKPANVIVTAENGVKLVDFSLASDVANRPAITMTSAGMALGTPYYIAPEVLRGEPATAAADLYAVGVLLYEMLTGSPPLGRFAKVSVKCSLPSEADALVEKLLAESPANRLNDAARLTTQLQELKELVQRGPELRARRRRWKLAGIGVGLALGAGLIGYSLPRKVPVYAPTALNSRGFPNPAAATLDVPFTNSLGMQFVPVSGRDLLACVDETLQRHLQTFQAANQDPADPWQTQIEFGKTTRAPLFDLTDAGWVRPPQEEKWIAGVIAAGTDRPAGGINIFMARRFCGWLSWKEQREGRLSPGEFYRLPTDEEWSALAGVLGEIGDTPQERHLSLPPTAAKFPWGSDWPPPPNFANYAGEEVTAGVWPAGWSHLPIRCDSFAGAAPIASFPKQNSLHDVWGNLWEWCESTPAPNVTKYVLRGGSWVDGGYQDQLRRDYRRMELGARRETCMGFRCVLQFSKSKEQAPP